MASVILKQGEVERLRVLKGWSAEKLAAEARVDPRTVSSIERGSRNAYPETLRRVAEALGVTIEAITETPTPATPESPKQQWFEIDIRIGVPFDRMSEPAIMSFLTALQNLAKSPDMLMVKARGGSTIITLLVSADALARLADALDPSKMPKFAYDDLMDTPERKVTPEDIINKFGVEEVMEQSMSGLPIALRLIESVSEPRRVS